VETACCGKKNSQDFSGVYPIISDCVRGSIQLYCALHLASWREGGVLFPGGRYVRMMRV